MISDMLGAHLGPCQIVARDEDPLQIPDDIYYQISMGADIGHMPQENLMTVAGLPDHVAAKTHKAFMSPGDFCIVAGKDRLPIVLGVMVGMISVNGEDQGLLLG